eukprot:jgi/Picsp_1/2785/NSC_01011-R1_---NA---
MDDDHICGVMMYHMRVFHGMILSDPRRRVYKLRNVKFTGGVDAEMSEEMSDPWILGFDRLDSTSLPDYSLKDLSGANISSYG